MKPSFQLCTGRITVDPCIWKARWSYSTGEVAFGIVHTDDLAWIGGVGHVEQTQLEPRRAALLGGVLPDAEHQVLADGVQVGREAGDLEFAGDPRSGRIAQVEHVERIDLPERDGEPDVVHEAGRVELLTPAEAADLADRDESVALLLEHDEPGLAAVAVGPTASRRWRSPAGSPGTRRARTD